jgi:acyl-CoA thioester hydrolase
MIDDLPRCTVTIKVPFHDVDSMSVVWHGNYAKYFAAARCELLDKIDYNYNQMAESGYAWPVIDLRLKYVKPAVFNQRIDVEAVLVEYENRLKINYLIRDSVTNAKLTKGSTVQVAVDLSNNEMRLYSPQVLLDKLGIRK